MLHTPVMARSAATNDPSIRRAQILGLLGGEGLGFDALRAKLRPQPAVRTLHEDLAWLERQFPDRFRREQAHGTQGASRVVLRWLGRPPVILAQPLQWLTEEEVVSLIAARGLLRQPDLGVPATATPASVTDPLSRAADDLLARVGIKTFADALARDAVVVSRFGAEPADGVVLSACLAATVRGDGLRFAYTNVHGRRHAAVEAMALRMVLVKAEWFLLAWSDGLKLYRLARMTAMEPCRIPAGCPAWIPRQDIDGKLRDAFYATGSERSQDRVRVVVGVGPEAWPLVANRRWGDRQEIEEDVQGLPAGWRRLRFTTTGLTECRHWVLSHGGQMRAESPAALTAWVHAQAEEILATHGG
jgi:predicted DNA-binding transcriptional regulator YafY